MRKVLVHLFEVVIILCSCSMIVTAQDHVVDKTGCAAYADGVCAAPAIPDSVRIAALLKANEMATANAAFFLSLSDQQKQAWRELKKTKNEYDAQMNSLGTICAPNDKSKYVLDWDNKQGPYCKAKEAPLALPTPRPN